jgi:hypothetical protein
VVREETAVREETVILDPWFVIRETWAVPRGPAAEDREAWMVGRPNVIPAKAGGRETWTVGRAPVRTRPHASGTDAAKHTCRSGVPPRRQVEADGSAVAVGARRPSYKRKAVCRWSCAVTAVIPANASGRETRVTGCGPWPVKAVIPAKAGGRETRLMKAVIPAQAGIQDGRLGETAPPLCSTAPPASPPPSASFGPSSPSYSRVIPGLIPTPHGEMVIHGTHSLFYMLMPIWLTPTEKTGFPNRFFTTTLEPSKATSLNWNA